jgi:hypothetical protein
MRMRLQYPVAAIAIVFYVAAFFLPTVAPFNPANSDTVFDGADAFAAGWRALLAFAPEESDYWLMSAAWLANPLIWLAFIATIVGRRQVCWVTAIAGLLLCLVALVRFGRTVGNNPGYWAWVASAAVLTVGSFLRRTQTASDNRTEFTAQSSQ